MGWSVTMPDACQTAVDVATFLMRAGFRAPSFEEMETLVMQALRDSYPLLTDEELRRNNSEGRETVQKAREAFLRKDQD